tara:strand:- start:251 stop:463 length:213 start_codon:yes stop_codon:yes gene_type:complete
MEKIKGIYVDKEAQEASDQLDGLVEQMIITMKLKGQKSLYAFDVTKDVRLRNLILASMDDSYDEEVKEDA